MWILGGEGLPPPGLHPRRRSEERRVGDAGVGVAAGGGGCGAGAGGRRARAGAGRGWGVGGPAEGGGGGGRGGGKGGMAVVGGGIEGRGSLDVDTRWGGAPPSRPPPAA